jgi:hypothetical protein
MSATELRLSDLTGRVVRDVDGRKVGRIEELFAELEQHEDGNDYVVTEFHVGSFGALETVGGGELLRHLLARVGRLVGYKTYRVPWEAMDLSDPQRPTLTVRREELEEDQDREREQAEQARAEAKRQHEQQKEANDQEAQRR